MQGKIDELKRLFDNGVIDRKTYNRKKMELIDEMLKAVDERVVELEAQGPDTGC